jgi:hypothetical protein
MLCGVTNAEIGKRIKRKGILTNAEIGRRIKRRGILTAAYSVKWKWGKPCVETSAYGRRLRQCGGAGMGRRGCGPPQNLQADTFKRLAGQWSLSAKHRREFNRHTQLWYNEGYKLRKHKQKVVAPVYLVVQVPTDKTEVN